MQSLASRRCGAGRGVGWRGVRARGERQPGRCGKRTRWQRASAAAEATAAVVRRVRGRRGVAIVLSAMLMRLRGPGRRSAGMRACHAGQQGGDQQQAEQGGTRGHPHSIVRAA